MYFLRCDATARLAPPTPTWNEKPWSISPEAAIRSKAFFAILRSTGFLVILAAPVAIFAGSPMQSAMTIWSISFWLIETLGERGKGTGSSVTAITWEA